MVRMSHQTKGTETGCLVPVALDQTHANTYRNEGENSQVYSFSTHPRYNGEDQQSEIVQTLTKAMSSCGNKLYSSKSRAGIMQSTLFSGAVANVLTREYRYLQASCD